MIKQEICEQWLTSDTPAFNLYVREINQVLCKQEFIVGIFPIMDPTIWHTYRQNVLKFQAIVMSSC